MKKWLLLIVFACSACGSIVSSDTSPDTFDAESSDEFVMDVAHRTDAIDVTAFDAVDVFDAAADRSVVDDTSDADATADADVYFADASDGDTNTVPCIGVEPRPAGVGRSCFEREGGVDPDLCNEVHYCGGQFVAGSPNAYVAPFLRRRQQLYRYESCDYYPAIVLSGYVDAYEVTVARFRTWVQAGMPAPNVGDFILDNVRWTADNARYLQNARFPYFEDGSLLPNDPRPRRAACTWTADADTNELMPINCVEPATAAAFCHWDGKTLLNEIAWEYLARNRGRTEVPFGNSINDPSVCFRADVGGWVPVAGGGTLCPSMAFPRQVTDRDRDVTTDPPGIYGLFGGVREYTIQTVYNPPGTQLRGAAVACAGQRRTEVVTEGMGIEVWAAPFLRWTAPQLSVGARGASWFDATEFEFQRYAATMSESSASSVAEGFRCGRHERPNR